MTLTDFIYGKSRAAKRKGKASTLRLGSPTSGADHPHSPPSPASFQSPEIFDIQERQQRSTDLSSSQYSDDPATTQLQNDDDEIDEIDDEITDLHRLPSARKKLLRISQSPRVQVDFNYEPLSRWFPQDMLHKDELHRDDDYDNLTLEDAIDRARGPSNSDYNNSSHSASFPNMPTARSERSASTADEKIASGSRSKKQSGSSGTIVTGLEKGARGKFYEEELMDRDESSSFVDLNDSDEHLLSKVNMGYTRKLPPAPIQIPHDPEEKPHSDPPLSEGPPSEPSQYSYSSQNLSVNPHESPSSEELSAISGSTLARALIANSFVLSADSAPPSSRHRSMMTRQDSATLPHSGYPSPRRGGPAQWDTSDGARSATSAPPFALLSPLSVALSASKSKRHSVIVDAGGAGAEMSMRLGDLLNRHPGEPSGAPEPAVDDGPLDDEALDTVYRTRSKRHSGDIQALRRISRISEVSSTDSPTRPSTPDVLDPDPQQLYVPSLIIPKLSPSSGSFINDKFGRETAPLSPLIERSSEASRSEASRSEADDQASSDTPEPPKNEEVVPDGINPPLERSSSGSRFLSSLPPAGPRSSRTPSPSSSVGEPSSRLSIRSKVSKVLLGATATGNAVWPVRLEWGLSRTLSDSRLPTSSEQKRSITLLPIGERSPSALSKRSFTSGGESRASPVGARPSSRTSNTSSPVAMEKPMLHQSSSGTLSNHRPSSRDSPDRHRSRANATSSEASLTGAAPKSPVSSPDILDMMFAPVARPIFSRKRSGSTPDPIHIVHSAEDGAVYEVADVPSSAGHTGSSGLHSAGNVQTFPETPNLFSPMWSAGVGATSPMPPRAAGDESALSVALDSASSVYSSASLPREDPVSVAVAQMASPSVATTFAIRPRDASLTRSATLPLLRPPTLMMQQSDGNVNHHKLSPVVEDSASMSSISHRMETADNSKGISPIVEQAPTAARLSTSGPTSRSSPEPALRGSSRHSLRKSSRARSRSSRSSYSRSSSGSTQPDPLSREPSPAVVSPSSTSPSASPSPSPVRPNALLSLDSHVNVPGPSSKPLTPPPPPPMHHYPPPLQLSSTERRPPMTIRQRTDPFGGSSSGSSFASSFVAPPPYQATVGSPGLQSAPQNTRPRSGLINSGAAQSSPSEYGPNSAPLSTGSSNNASTYPSGGRRARTRPPLPAGPRRPTAGSITGSFLAGMRDRAGSVSSVTGYGTKEDLPVGLQRFSVAVGSSAPKFQTSPPRWRGYTMEAAKWTFTSQQLQAVVSRAIKHTAEASSIRLLKPEAVDHEIPKELQRLASLRTDLKTRYMLMVRKRWMLMGSLATQFDIEHNDDPTMVLRLMDKLSEVNATLDQLAEELHSVTDQIGELKSLLNVHSASALAMALRKLNSSFLNKAAEGELLRQRIDVLESERDEAWKQAEALADEVDRLNEACENISLDSPKAPSARSSLRSSRVMAARKSSFRASKGGLRSSISRKSLRNSTASPAVSAFGPDVPPVPAMPSLEGDANDITYHNSAGISAVSRDSETQALLKAQDELYEMLGIPREEAKEDRPRPRSISGPISAKSHSSHLVPSRTNSERLEKRRFSDTDSPP